MLNIVELRMGNFIQRDSITLTFHSIDPGTDDYIWLQNSNNYQTISWCYLNILKPIRLKDDWLIKLGFSFKKHKSGTQGIYSNGKMNLTLSNSGNVYYMKQLIPYVHRLQNLYFELKNEELKIVV